MTSFKISIAVCVVVGLVVGKIAGEQGGAGEIENVVTNSGEERDIHAQTMGMKRYPEHLDPYYPLWVRMGECPKSLDGNHKHFCPSPNSEGKWICVDDYQLCDGTKNCPNAEDESRGYCLFYKVLKTEVNMLTESIAALNKGVAEVILGDEERDGYRVQQEDDPGRSTRSRFHRQHGQFYPAN